MCILCRKENIGDLSDLDCSGCETLSSIDIIEKCYGMVNINCSGCPNLKTINRIPTGVNMLDCSRCPSLEKVHITNTGFSCLKYYNCSDCPKLTQIWSEDADLYQLETLVLDGSVNIKLPKLINTKITFLSCRNFNITNVPFLPYTLDVLNLTDCKYIEEIPNFPRDMRGITLNGCLSLRKIPQLEEGCYRLKNLDMKGCDRFDFKSLVFPSEMRDTFEFTR